MIPFFRKSIILTVLILLSCSQKNAPINNFKVFEPEFRLKDSEKEPWKIFYAAVTCLQDQGDRKSSGNLFKEVSEKFPQSDYAQQAKELSELLGEMVKEDAEWNEPKNIEQFNLENKVQYWIYHLRNVNCYQNEQPGMCHLLSVFNQNKKIVNAAVKIKEIGEPAIPALIKLLEDRRPTRSIGYWRDFSPSRTVLRYQDAAMQILNELTPAPFYRNGSIGAYFSNLNPEYQAKVISSINSWYIKSRGKSKEEQMWIAIDEDPEIYQLLYILERLSEKPDQKGLVLKKLNRLYKIRDPIQRPQISWLMCKLGDNSKLEEVSDSFFGDLYNSGRQLPDDSAPGSNAKDYALRQLILYGRENDLANLRKYLSMKDEPNLKKKAIFAMLLEIISENFSGLPKGYLKVNFPLYLLIEALESQEEYGHGTDGKSVWTIRKCDATAGAIQSFTGINFGYIQNATIDKKDIAIEKIRLWWRNHSKKDDDPKKSSSDYSKTPEAK